MDDEIKILQTQLSLLKEISVEKIDMMNRLTSLLQSPQPKEADEIAQRAIMEARAIDYEKGEAVALLNAGINASALRKFSAASDFYKRALKFLKQKPMKHKSQTFSLNWAT